ncbi:MAG: hypothetical protein V1906_01015 [Candidatus Woesearchaeota archaeon]
MKLTGIIGDRRMGRYDPTLADRMNKEADERARMEALEARLKLEAKPIRKQGPKIVTLDDSAGILDKESALDGKIKTQDQWIEHWNCINDGRYFASMKDMYDAFRQIRQESDKHKELLANLRKDFKESWIVASTRIIYNPDDLGARIVHHYGSSNDSLKREFTLDVPIYNGVNISTAFGNQSGINYLQAFFGTADNPDTIIETIEHISGKNKEKIYLWTPERDSRRSFSDRAAWLGYVNVGFILNGGVIIIGNNGRSFGVRYASDSER